MVHAFACCSIHSIYVSREAQVIITSRGKASASHPPSMVSMFWMYTTTSASLSRAGLVGGPSPTYCSRALAAAWLIALCASACPLSSPAAINS